MSSKQLFECCKKVFIHYVCVKCSKVYHKTCLTKNKQKVEYIADNQIVCCEQHDRNCELDATILERTIQELSEEAQMKDKFIENLKKARHDLLEDALKNESEMTMRLEEQQTIIEELKQQISDLKNKLQETVKDYQEKEIQTASLKKHISTMTDNAKTLYDKEILNTVFQTSSMENSCISSNTPTSSKIDPKITNSHDTPKNKILFVGGKHGQGMAKSLFTSAHDFSGYSIVKPNASNEILIQTAINHSKNITSNDVVVLWLDKVNVCSCKYVLTHFQNLKLIMLTKPYRFDINGINEVIYQKNLRLYEKFYRRKTSSQIILDCNNVFRKSNYLKNGMEVNRIGKKFLCEKIIQLIINRKETTSHNNNLIQREDQAYHTPSNKGVTRTEKLATSFPTLKNSDQSFLYPRLSQITFA